MKKRVRKVGLTGETAQKERTPRTVAYLRVSTTDQDLKGPCGYS